MKLFVMYDIIYYGLVGLDDFPEEKARRLLTEVKSELNKIYYNNVESIFK